MPLFDTSLPDSEVHSDAEAARIEEDLHPKSLTPRRLFWVIFGALWAFALSSSIVYFVVRALFAALQ